MNGTLVLDRGDINLTFKRYLEAPVRITIETTTSSASTATAPMPS